MRLPVVATTRMWLPAAAIALLVLGLGCASIERFGGPSAEEKRALSDAMVQLNRDPRAAEAGLKEFLEKYPKSQLADDAAVALAGIEREKGNHGYALELYYRAIRMGGDRSDAARVHAATLETELGNPGDAARLMGRVREDRLTPEERRLAYRVFADVLSDPVAQLRWLARLRAEETNPDAVALVDVEIDEILQSLDSRDLGRAARQINREIPAARIQMLVAERALEAGDADAARDAIRRAERLPTPPQYVGRLSATRERLRLTEEGPPDLSDLPTFSQMSTRAPPSTDQAVGTVGVVLPLSGRFAQFGEESLQGILLAAGIFDEARSNRAPRPRVRLVIRDSEGRPERAAAAVRNLAEDPTVMAIVGPLLGRESEAAAEAAEAVGIPLVALSARREVARERPFVFRVRTMPQEEVSLLVDHATRDLGAVTFAILYPRDTYGRGLRDLFWDAVEERGGEIVGVASYEPDATDFAAPIRRLVGYTLLTVEEKKLLKKRDGMRRKARRLPPEEALALREEALALTGPEGESLPPIVDFDALFIPESHEKVVLIAPQLAYHEATGARLLGPNDWYHGDLLQISRKHVEGALLTAQFFPGSDLAFVRDFTDSYHATFQVQPDAFAAQGFDAAKLVLVQLARGAGTREDVRDGMLATRSYPGVTGILTMRPDGNAHKRPYLLEVERGRFVQIE
jgi:ABC-type branched-subunit amino acid transport system substrate-binding protein